MRERIAKLMAVIMISIPVIIMVMPPVRTEAAGIAMEEHMNDDSLTSISIPSGTTYIGDRAYYGCSNLYSVVIPDGVTGIGESAFAMCPQLATVSIPPSVKTIKPGAFAGDGALVTLTFNGSNNNFFYSDGVLYNPATTEIISYLPGNRKVQYKFPDTVKKIDKYAFWGANYLQRVVVCSGITSITPYDFAFCSGLQYVYLPSSVKSIQEYAFRDCVSLKGVYAESKSIKINDTAFYNCRSALQTVSGADYTMFSQYSGMSDDNTDNQGNEEITVGDISVSDDSGTAEEIDVSGDEGASATVTKSVSGTSSSSESAYARRARELTEMLQGPYRGTINSYYLVNRQITGSGGTFTLSANKAPFR